MVRQNVIIFAMPLTAMRSAGLCDKAVGVMVSICPWAGQSVTSSPDNTRLWDQFWDSGRQACCVEHDGVNYAQDFRQPWISFFSRLTDSDRVLDLCTGNGAVLTIALEHAEKNALSVRLDGVDSARIKPQENNPELATKLAGISFHAQTSATDLPFEDDTFDYVTSQYGIEYTPLSQTSRELLRVLKPDGLGRFIMHAAEGVTVDYAKRELGDIAELTNEISIFPAAQNALRLVCGVERKQGKATSDEIAASKTAHDDYHERLTLLGKTWQQRTAAAVFRETGSILQHTFQNRHRFPLDVLLGKVMETEESVELHRDRLRALVEAARSSDDCAEITKYFLELGCKAAAAAALHDAGGGILLGWRIDIRN